jgi:hypothetical protein
MPSKGTDPPPSDSASPAAPSAALSVEPSPQPPPDADRYLDDVLRDDWLKSKLPADINPGDTMGYLWANFGTGGDYTLIVQQKLAAILKDAYKVHLQPATLPATLTFAQLQHLVGHS